MIDTDQDRWLESLLEEEPYIADDGFTDAVVARLPSGGPASRRPWVLLGSTLLGGAVFVGVGGGVSVELLARLGEALTSGEGPAGLAFQPTVTTLVALAAVATLAWVPLTIAFDED